MQIKSPSNNLEWQSAPSKNLVFDLPDKSRQENSLQNTKVTSVSVIEQIFRDKMHKCTSVDLTYSCPDCGTLDVMIKISPSGKNLEIDCLDCKKISTCNIHGVMTKCP